MTYSQYPYSRLLDFIVRGCQHQDEEKDFAGYLLSMEQANSINELVSIYNDIYLFLETLTSEKGHSTDYLYQISALGIDKLELFQELGDYFNDNILRLYKDSNGSKNLSREKYITFLVNLRDISHNVSTIQAEILSEANKYSGYIERFTITRKKQFNCRMKFVHNGEASDSDLEDYIKASKLLVFHGRIFDIAEINFAKENDIDYEKLKQLHKAELEKNELEAQERRRKKREQQKEIDKENIKELCKFAAYVILAIVIINLITIVILVKGKEMLLKEVAGYYQIAALFLVIDAVIYLGLKYKEYRCGTLSYNLEQCKLYSFAGLFLFSLFPPILFTMEFIIKNIFYIICIFALI